MQPPPLPTGLTPDEFSVLSARFVVLLAETFQSAEESRMWPMSDKRDELLRAFWNAAAADAGPKARTYQPNRLEVHMMREDDHLLGFMLLPTLAGSVCCSAGVWLFGPINPEVSKLHEGGSARFFVMGQDMADASQARLYEVIDGELTQRGELSAADEHLFLDTVVARYLKGECTTSVPSGDPDMEGAMETARSLTSYFVETLQAYPAIEDYSVKIRIEDGADVEYFWLENTRWDNGSFRGTLGNEPTRVRNVAYGQQLTITPEQIVDWYYMWEGKMRGNYTLRASLPYLDPAQADQLRAILEEG